MLKRIGMAAVATTLAVSLVGCGADDNTRNRNDRFRTQSNQNGAGNGVINPSGIGVNNNANGNGTMNQGPGGMGQGNMGQGGMNQGTAHNDMTTGQNGLNDQEQRLMKRIRDVNGVNDATVFVNGNDIIVGIEVDNVGKRDQIEEKVRKALQNDKENKDYTVHVTSERSMHERIRSIHGQMQSTDGHPIRDMANDIGQLLEDMGNAVTRPFR